MDYGAPSSALWSGQAPGPDMSSQLMIREYPHRTIAIASKSHVLIFRYSASTSEGIGRSRGGDGGGGTSSKCMVEFSPKTKHLLDDYRPLTPRPIYGTLGLISIGRDVFLCVITQASRVAMLRPGETIERIIAVEFFCLNTNEYDNVLSLDPWESESDQGGFSRRDVSDEHPCQELQKLLSNGTFYYSTDFDLTNRLQDRPVDTSTFNIEKFDESFLWNSFMIRPLLEFRSHLLPPEMEALDSSRILTSAIRGFCSAITIPQSSAPLRSARSGMPSYLSVVSRLSCRRAGTRFNSRGIDDDGNVANFVETETIFWSPSGVIFSYAQVRGSVPVFWEQTAGLIPGQQKISITRSREGTQPAFDKHFAELEHTYGAVHVVNLLSESKPGEAELSALYRHGLQYSPLSQKGEKGSSSHALLRSTMYDFHAETKGPSGYEAAQQIRRYIERSADGFAYYLAEEADDAGEPGKGSSGDRRRYVVVLQQEGVFRTNCLDCLDRTNLIQTIISQMAVEAFLNHRGEHALSDFWMRHSTLWADNGDHLSRIYAGTGALKSSFTRHGKMSLAGAIADARKSATRLYINNFADKGRQNTIDQLLGRLYGQAPVVLYDPINDFVAAELNRRTAEFSSTEVIRIWVGTFNLNGRTDGIEEDLSPWICPDILGSSQPEIVVVGFQEIVELSPQQIMNSDPRSRVLWERSVKKTLNNRADALGGERYVLLRSGQLVGAALCIFVKSSTMKNIKNVEGSVKKTGMSGIAGNKGAVAIRFDYANTHICFVTAHLAAGFANYDERNKDYATIHHGLRFQRNRGIDDHDTVIWLGDFNYRIGLSREKTIELVRKGDLETLYDNDQLNLQMVAGLSFPFYSESRIAFLPTYRFDIGKDEYDSSEKQRIPAWTDRILRRGANIRQTSYNSAPLRFSDHRPVFATFDCIVNIVDESTRNKISRGIYAKRKAEVGDSTANVKTEDTDDEELMGYDAIEPGLPPASSDRQKWWLDNGKMARSTVQPPRVVNAPTHSSAVLNPNRPGNPFVPTEEPDWVTVPRAESRQSVSSMSSSPYEHITHSAVMGPPSVSSQTARKKLPPALDAASSSGSSTVKMGRASTTVWDPNPGKAKREETPPPPPPRRQTGAAAAAITTAPTKTLSSASAPSQNAPLASRTATMPIIPPPRKGGSSSSSSSSQKVVTVPTPPPPRPPPASTTSSSVVSSQKTPVKSAKAAPPPVAKKPAHLSSLSPSSSPKPQQSQEFSVAPRAMSPGRAAVSLRGVASKYAVGRDDGTSSAKGGGDSEEEPPPPPKPPRRTATEVVGPPPSRKPVPAGAVGLAGMATATTTMMDNRPKPPGRKPSIPSKPALVQGVVAKKQTTVDLLGDDANGSINGWETLKPTK